MVTLGIAFFVLLNGLSFDIYKKKTEGEKYLRYKQAALSSLRRGWPEKALHYLEEADTLQDEVGTESQFEDDSLNKYLGNALNTQAVKYYRDQKLQEAIRFFSKAVELYPYSAEIHKNTGAVFYYDTKDYKKALHHFQRSLELDPDQSQAENPGNCGDRSHDFGLSRKLA